ncbi:MAG: T9SS type A sorting domain-containing protein [Chitinophagaceae bacterium]|nr:T9SS type A sorting domain-containing protein [Chitinophagaceae bacterium]
MIRNCTLILSFLFLCKFAMAQDGLPDPGFATNGFFQANYGKGKITAYTAIKLANGKTLVGGYRNLGNSSDNALTMLNEDGSLDESFGINGTSVFSTSPSNDTIVQIMELPNTDILVLSAGTGIPYGVEVQLSRLKSNGQLDNSFGVSGTARWGKNSSNLHNTSPQQMIRTSDGSLLVLCLATVDNYRPSIVKFNSNGTVIPSFGINGVFTSNTTVSAFIYQLPKARMHLNTDRSVLIYAIQPRITGAIHDSLHLEKVLSDGNRDLSFGPNGDGVMRKVITTEKVNFGDGVTVSDGNIMMVMETPRLNDENFVLAYKFKPDGSPVTSFGNNGLSDVYLNSGWFTNTRLTALPDAEVAVTGSLLYGSSETFLSMTIMNETGNTTEFGYGSGIMLIDMGFQSAGGQMISNPDGTFLVVGSGYDQNKKEYAVSLAQMDEWGSYVGLYYKKFNNTRNNNDAQALAVTSDGKIIAGGYTFRSAERSLMLTRINANGTPDYSFQNGEPYITTVGTQDDVQAINPLPDGKILIVGNSFSSSFEPFIFFHKLNSNGSPDNSFGTAGLLKPATGAGISPRCVIFLPNGKILVAGNANGQMRLLRYNADGTPDLSFNSTGSITLSFGTPSSFMEHVMVQNDGKILATGTARDGINSYFGVIRLNDNGSFDNNFNGTGIRTIAAYGTSNTGRFSLQQADGKIVVGGYSNVAGGSHFSITRLNSDGSADPGFGIGGSNYISIFNTSQPSKAMLLPDGRILMAGIALAGGGNGGALAMFNANGTVHTGFGTNGYYFSINGGEFRGLRYLSNSNQILVSGRAAAGGITDVLVGKFNYTPATLPLTWNNFTASKLNGSVELKWSTIQEINTKDFDVQFSIDGLKWNTIQRTSAAGNSNSLQQYRYLHAGPVKGLNQYRILQRDLDGRSSYSPIRMIWMNGSERLFKVLNTVVTNGLIRMIVNETGGATIRVINTSGQVIAVKKASEGLNEIDASGWASGIYYVVSNGETEKISIR